MSTMRRLTAPLGCAFLTNFDTTVVLTLLPVAIFSGQHVDPWDYSLALTTHIGISLLGSLAGPWLCRHVGIGPTLAAVTACKGVAYALLTVAITLPALLTFAVLTGIARGVGRVLVRVLISDAVPSSEHRRGFELFFIVGNLALLTAPLVAKAAHLGQQVLPTLWTLAALQAGAAWWLVRRWPPLAPPTPSLTTDVKPRVFTQASVLNILGLTSLSYAAIGFALGALFLFEHVNPAVAPHRELLLAYEPLALIVGQLALMPLARRWPRHRVYAVSATTLGGGLILVFQPSLPLVALGLTAFALGCCLALPQGQADVVRAAPAGTTALVLTGSSICATVGETLGTMASSLLTRPHLAPAPLVAWTEKLGAPTPAASVAIALSVAFAIALLICAVGTRWTLHRLGDATPTPSRYRRPASAT